MRRSGLIPATPPPFARAASSTRESSGTIAPFKTSTKPSGSMPMSRQHFSGRAYALRFVGQYERAIADYRQALTLQLDDTGRNQIARILKQLEPPTERDATPTAVTKR